MTAPAAIRCSGVTKAFGSVQAVRGLDLELARGQILALVGPSGCGKTTALRLIAGFEVPDAGTIELGGVVVASTTRFVPPERRRVGVVPQEYALFPHLTVAENIAYGLSRRGGWRERVREVVELVRLSGLESRYPNQLSGGQQQRVALARALAPRPQVLLLDEPFSNLDAELRDRMRHEVVDILRRAGATAVLVTHDRQEALNTGDLVAVMRDGRVEQVGSPEAIYHSPATRYVAEFIGPASFLAGRVQDDGIATEVGTLRQKVGAAVGTVVEVLVRPDDVAIRPHAGGEGLIVEKVRRDGYYRYVVRLRSGARVESQLPHIYDYPVGTRVQVILDAGHPLQCFRNGTPLPEAEATG